MSTDTVTINRAPVLTLWGVVVAERLGYDHDAALTLGKCLAGLNAQAKGRRLGLFGPPKAGKGDKPKKAGLGRISGSSCAAGRCLPGRPSRACGRWSRTSRSTRTR